MQVGTKEILYLLANRFGLERNDTLDRLRLQKTIYLLQRYGLQVGYGFSWYKYGPYSQKLAYDAYTVLGPERSNYGQSHLEFSDSTVAKFNQFRSILGGILDNPTRLELVASVDFARNTWFQKASRDEFPSLFRDRKSRLIDGTEIADSDIKAAFDISTRLREN